MGETTRFGGGCRPARPGAARRSAVRARLASFGHAGRGLWLLLRREPNARIHLAVSVIVCAAALVLRLPSADWRWLVAAMALVWIAEALNTAVELLCDRVCAGFDPAIGRVKDAAAGAVLLAAIAAALIGLLTFLPPLRACLRW